MRLTYMHLTGLLTDLEPRFWSCAHLSSTTQESVMVVDELELHCLPLGQTLYHSLVPSEDAVEKHESVLLLL